MSLFEIDRLIRKTEYGEALEQLNVYIANNPNNFDNAQKRIKRIMNIRKQYSILAEKLINIILTDPENNKVIYEITAQLEKFEKHPSDENLQFIADLKKSAEFNYFRAKFMEVQNTSSELTQKGNYSEAIAYVRTEGFWLYRDSFYEKWEDNPQIIESVDKVINHLDAQVALFNERNFNQRLQRAVNEFVTAANNDRYEEAVRNFNTVDALFEEYAEIRNSIFKDAEKVQNLFTEIQKLDSDTTDASYLPFMYRFIFGIDSVADSGIVGAIDGQWKALVGKMNTAVFTDVTKYHDSFLANTNNKKYSASDIVNVNEGAVNSVKLWVTVEDRCIDLYKYLDVQKGKSFQNPFENYKILSNYVNSLLQNTYNTYKIENQLTTIKNNADITITKVQTAETDRERYAKELFDSCASIDSVVGVKVQKELNVVSWAKAYNERGFENWKLLSEKYSSQLEKNFEQSSSILNDVWNQLTAYYNSSADEMVLQVQNYNQLSEQFRNGFLNKIQTNEHQKMLSDSAYAVSYKPSEKTEENQIQIRYNYPDIAYNVALYAQRQVENNISKIDGFENVINSNYNSHPQWIVDEGVTKYVKECNEYLEAQKAKLTALKNDSVTLASTARSRMLAAQVARNEADMRFTEAEQALRGENFTLARRKLQDSLSKYEEALSVSNDEKLRNQWDTKLQELGDRINRTENEIVVKEVRNLKNQARDSYFNGRFDDAEKYLNQAKIRWSVTNAQEDSEITSLMSLVNNAISMQTGREILPSAPQYPEMSQLLNIANQYFDSGKAKYAAGNKAEGDKDLQQALESIQKVQYVYPLNQEAALLTLKINQLKDPKKFEDEFAQKIKTAQSLVKNKDTSQEGYTNLLDYYNLNPNYKGLKDIIYDVEIYLGIRAKPVDNSAQTRSKNLLANAQKQYNNAGNDLARLQASLETVDQALNLNPNNRQAQELKDKIITKMGGTASTTLSVEDERLYNQAIQYLQNNNVIAANQILNRLLSKPQNQYSQKIKDLKAKIDARM